MTESESYPIGTPGQPWGDTEKCQWLAAQSIKRSYRDDVVAPLMQLAESSAEVLKLEQYGALDYDPERYPLLLLMSQEWQAEKHTVLVTGGVHGYETSGVHGALRFAGTTLADYATDFNFVVAPCVSPWAYETINRWNPQAVDPNRSFRTGGPSQEANCLLHVMQDYEFAVRVHFDLHETTDTDNSEFRPALGARDAVVQKVWDIPDGFYLVGDSDQPAPDFQRAIIESVAAVTHIAAGDDGGRLIGEPLEQFGVINYPTKALGLCAGMTTADFVTTTEVYPDSPRASDEICISAQVAAIRGGLDYLRPAS